MDAKLKEAQELLARVNNLLASASVDAASYKQVRVGSGGQVVTALDEVLRALDSTCRATTQIELLLLALKQVALDRWLHGAT